jgi:hypothetical protein
MMDLTVDRLRLFLDLRIDFDIIHSLAIPHQDHRGHQTSGPGIIFTNPMTTYAADRNNYFPQKFISRNKYTPVSPRLDSETSPIEVQV